MFDFKQRVLLQVKKIPRGQVFTYQEIAKKVGNINATRAVGNILANNKNREIPCHRVIKSNYSLGGFHGSKNDSWEKAAMLLLEGWVGVIPTDTIYGLTALAFNSQAVDRIYQLKKRDSRKPLIVLISSFNDLKKFGVKLTSWQKQVLNQCWPGKTSVVLKCSPKKFVYLHRGRQTLAFRLPAKKNLIKLLKTVGPLVSTSANIEGYPPATTVTQAKKYFGKKVFYLDSGKIISKPSTLIDLTQKEVGLLRKGATRIYKK